MNKEKYEKQKSIDAKLIWVIFVFLLCFFFLWKLSLNHKEAVTQNQKFHAEVESYIRSCEPTVYELETTPEGINITIYVHRHNKTVSITMFIENGDEYKYLIKSGIEDIKEVLR